MGKREFVRTVLVLTCCGSLVSASCGDQSQAGRKGPIPVPGGTTTSASNPTNRLANSVVQLASTVAPVQSAATPAQIAAVNITTYQQFVTAETTLYLVFGVDVQNVLAAQQNLQTLLSIAADAKAVFSTIGAVVGPINSIVTIARFLGFLSTPDEVNTVNTNVLETAGAISLSNLQTNVDHDWDQSVTGINEVNGPPYDIDSGNHDTSAALTNLLSASDWTRIVDGSSDDSLTDGQAMLAPVSLNGTTTASPGTYGAHSSSINQFDPYGRFYLSNYMTWKQIVKGGSYTAPNMDGNTTPLQTFDWRLGAPYALKALANRLLVMGLIDPYFTTDGSYYGELLQAYTDLENLYNQMNNGVKCGSTDYIYYQGPVNTNVWPNTQQDVQACAVVCADIYTGFSVLSAITPNAPMTVPGHWYNNQLTTNNTSATCETAQQTTAYADAVNKTASAIRQEMPLFEMKAAIDSLYKMLNPYPSEDLTQLDGLIAPTAAADVCIGGLNDFGQVAPGNNLQLLQCDWSDASQLWSYDRVTGQISNRIYPNICIEMDGTTAGVTATMQTCATPQISKHDPQQTAGPIEIDNVNQKWTYNAGTNSLINGSGLALGWKAMQSNPTFIPAPGIGVVSNVWNQGSGWIDPSWDNSASADGTNMQWRSDSPAFTWPQDVTNASALTSSPGVAASGDYSQQLDVFWADSSNHLRQAEYNVSGGWLINPSNPADLGPDAAPPGNSPAATSWAPGRIDVVQDGANQGGCRLWHTWYDSGSWGWWEDLSYLQGPVAVDCTYPAAVSSWGQGRLDIFEINALTGGVGHLAYDSSLGGWQPMEDLGIPATWGTAGGHATSGPAAVSWGPNRIDVVVRGADWNIYHAAYQDGYWYGWDNLGGDTTAGGATPTITAFQPNRLDIFEVGSNFHINHLIWDNAWEPWTDMGITAPRSLSAVSNSAAYMFMFGRDSNNALWQTIAE